MTAQQTVTLPTEPVAILSDEFGEVRYTVAMLEFLQSSGLLEGRFELINGRIYYKMGQNMPHGTALARMMKYIFGIETFGEDCVLTDVTVVSDVLERPAPDVLVLKELIAEKNPKGTEVLLAVEITDTTKVRDYDEKPTIYARAGVAEYWILDVNARTLTVFRQPDAATGGWGSKNTLSETQSVAPQSAPDAVKKIAELLPPAP